MSVTPLHFHRARVANGNYRVVHGISDYVTDCGRFNVGTFADGWLITVHHKTPHYDLWFKWLQLTGLSAELFDTRRAAVTALRDGLGYDDLLTAEDPSAALV